VPPGYRVCVFVRVSGGGTTLLVSQITPPTVVEVVLGSVNMRSQAVTRRESGCCPLVTVVPLSVQVVCNIDNVINHSRDVLNRHALRY